MYQLFFTIKPHKVETVANTEHVLYDIEFQSEGVLESDWLEVERHPSRRFEHNILSNSSNHF